MTDSGLSAPQLEVIDALSSGVSLSDAAAEAGVDCATIAYWRRNFPRFHAALAHAQYDRALMFRERAEPAAPAAQKCTTINNPQTRHNMHKIAQTQQPCRPCPCGSCKKYKQGCLGNPLAAAA